MSCGGIKFESNWLAFSYRKIFLWKTAYDLVLHLLPWLWITIF